MLSNMKARSDQNHDNKIAPQVNFNPTAANIMLAIIFSNKSYFCFKSDGQEISTIEWQELKNQLSSFFVHK